MEQLDYQRELPVASDWDIIVVGGGPSGVAAAIAAGRQGHKVALIEQLGSLGGLGTSGLVNVFMPFGDDRHTLMQGIGLELVKAMHERGFLPDTVTPDVWEQGLRRAVPFNGEGMKLLMDEWVEAAGVEIRFFTSLVDAVAEDGRIQAIILSGKQGLYAIRAPLYVDATGDAVLSAMAGVPFEVGDEAGNTQAPTLCSLVAQIDLDRYRAFREETRRPDDWQSLLVPLEQAIEDGVFTVPELHLPGIFATGDGYGILNAGHLYNVDGLKDEDLTRAMIRGRKLAQEYMTFYREYVDGCEEIAHMATAAILGVRETRRIVGEYVLSVDDFVARRSFDDEIGRHNYSIDIHRSSPSREDYEALVEEFTQGYRLGEGESYGIPYRSLVPKGVDNLLVAGRCISTDRMVQGSIRVMPGCLITGQAAGTAAALSKDQDVSPRELDPSLLRDLLSAQGAYLPA
jgi:hypothetical protein